MRLAIVGTGNIGSPLAVRALCAGHQVTVCDRIAGAARAALAAGADWAATPRAAAEAAEVTLTCLPGPDQVRAAVLGDDGVLSGLGPGRALIECSTIGPDLARELHARVERAGADMLDAPVSRGRADQNTEEGGLTFMVGGRRQTFQRWEPLLRQLGRLVVHLGQGGAGATAKLVTQYVGFVGFVATAEAMAVAAKAGLDLDALAEVVPNSAAATRTFTTFVDSVLPRQFEAGTAGRATLDVVAKDLGLACQLARSVAAPATLGVLAEDYFRRAQAAGLGSSAYASVVRVVEQLAGVTIATEVAGTAT